MKWMRQYKVLTLIASRSFGSSWMYLRIHVRMLAVVSCAANNTPMMLSRIWSSLNISPFSSLKFNRLPKKSFCTEFFSFLTLIISKRIWPIFFLAFKILNTTPPKKKKKKHLRVKLKASLLVFWQEKEGTINHAYQDWCIVWSTR